MNLGVFIIKQYSNELFIKQNKFNIAPHRFTALLPYLMSWGNI